MAECLAEFELGTLNTIRRKVPREGRARGSDRAKNTYGLEKSMPVNERNTEFATANVCFLQN